MTLATKRADEVGSAGHLEEIDSSYAPSLGVSQFLFDSFGKLSFGG